MLPLHEFDDADSMRAFFATLTTEGARPDRFRGVAREPLVAIEREAGRFARARLDVPREAPFFADHFPRRPVFPGTLLLDRMTTLAADLVHERFPAARPFARLVTDVKLRAFTDPGSTLELAATLDDGDEPIAVVEARVPGQRRPVGGARVRFEVQA
jgi:3-hydroxymyristoyl/3-hydroxydecanoyl-(acyl carrier protein) dehydratase